MKIRLVVSAVLALIYGVFEAIWTRSYTQLQGVATARALNDDSIWGNATNMWFRSTDLVSILATAALIVILAVIWVPFLKKLS